MMKRAMTFSAIALALAACNGGIGGPDPAPAPDIAPEAGAPAEPGAGADPIAPAPTPEPTPTPAPAPAPGTEAEVEAVPLGDDSAQVTPAAEPLPFVGDGYPQTGDECRRLGENEYTAEFLDHTADLVACPEDYAGLDAFVVSNNADMLDRTQGHVVLSVPAVQ